MSQKLTLWERFWQKVEITPDGHWLWKGGLYPNGYGYFCISSTPRKQVMAHRWLWEQVKGPIPDKHDLDHLLICRIGNCVNYDHLEPVTRKVNAQRREIARRMGMPAYAISRKRTGLHGRDKTHCKRGHPFDEENTHHYNGKRYCKACQKLHQDARLAKEEVREEIRRRTRMVSLKKRPRHGRDKKYCLRGHFFTPENTYIWRGKRHCKQCRMIRETIRRQNPEYLAKALARAAADQRDLRVRQRGGPPQTMNKDKTHCPAGHPYAGDNLSVRKSGERNCRTCQRAQQHQGYLRRKARAAAALPL